MSLTLKLETPHARILHLPRIDEQSAQLRNLALSLRKATPQRGDEIASYLFSRRLIADSSQIADIV